MRTLLPSLELRRFFSLISCLLWLLPFLCRGQELASKDPEALRFMSYNVRICLGMDNQTDPDRVPEVINRVNLQAGNDHYIRIKNNKQLRDYFKYNPKRPILISGHRGGMLEGYPENCIESFEKTLSFMESFFEIDPRLTKDSVIVLMHDKTIDRTTTGKGAVSDYTYEELRQFNLVDRDGNVTDYKIPTLRECIEWSYGKTILNLDIKDVPLDVMADFLAGMRPVNVMLTVHDAKQARFYYDRNDQVMLSCWCKNMDEFFAYEKAGIPWRQVMAYVGPKMKPEQRELYDRLHDEKVLCMISVSPTHDNAKTDEAKVAGYESEIKTSPDVIETDYPFLFQKACLSRK